MSSHNRGDLVTLSESGWKWESLLVVWHENCCYCTVWESVWRLLLLYVYENCMRIAAVVLNENRLRLYCTAAIPDESSPWNSQMKHFLNKLRRKRKRKKKKFTTWFQTSKHRKRQQPTIPTNNKSTSHSYKDLIMKFIHQSAKNPGL